MKRHVLLGQEIVEFFTHSVSSFTFDRSPYEPEAEPGRNLPFIAIWYILAALLQNVASFLSTRAFDKANNW